MNVKFCSVRPVVRVFAYACMRERVCVCDERGKGEGGGRVIRIIGINMVHGPNTPPATDIKLLHRQRRTAAANMTTDGLARDGRPSMSCVGQRLLLFGSQPLPARGTATLPVFPAATAWFHGSTVQRGQGSPCDRIEAMRVAAS